MLLDITLSVFPFVIDCDITANNCQNPLLEDVSQVIFIFDKPKGDKATLISECIRHCHTAQ